MAQTVKKMNVFGEEYVLPEGGGTGGNSEQIGDLDDLRTSYKGDLVGAINEVFSCIGDVSVALGHIAMLQEEYIAQSPVPVGEGV